ncbi:MAG TPA: AAA family ATPase [Candidatus Pullilachnospira stercoravium]|uniref:AAA family ATPase n=1 Tax=Candidatus Pullilachnospira stercoravium TaxID=2840913 RepID=A0A9D1NUI4_9FIRM|nr:AAA family ATPase [Candidatus Pullilachnospira stercoravium]
MKHLYIIGGTMGVGKTTVCRILKEKLEGSVFLDGDWCWDMHPFQVTEETKRMVQENIVFLLNNFLSCTAYDHVIFCWVLHQQNIIDDLLARLRTDNCEVHLISLVCTPGELARRIQKDVETGIRGEDAVGRSLSRLALYDSLSTLKLDVTELTPEETAGQILRLTSSR